MTSILFLITISHSPFFQILTDYFKGSNYNRYHHHILHFQLLSKVQFFTCLYFRYVVSWNGKIHKMTRSFFLGWFSLLAWIVSQSKWDFFFVLFSSTNSGLCICTIWRIDQNETCSAQVEKKGPTHKLRSLMDSYAWTHQCKLTNKDLRV